MKTALAFHGDDEDPDEARTAFEYVVHPRPTTTTATAWEWGYPVIAWSEVHGSDAWPL